MFNDLRLELIMAISKINELKYKIEELKHHNYMASVKITSLKKYIRKLKRKKKGV